MRKLFNIKKHQENNDEYVVVPQKVEKNNTPIIILVILILLVLSGSILTVKYINLTKTSDYVFEQPSVVDELDRGLKRTDVAVGTFVKGDDENIFIKIAGDENTVKIPVMPTFGYVCTDQEITDKAEYDFNKGKKLWRVKPKEISSYIAGERVIVLFAANTNPSRIGTLASNICPNIPDGVDLINVKIE